MILGIISQSLVMIVRFSLDVYEVIIDLPETSSRSRRHGAKKSGSTVLFLFQFIGVDYELTALFEKQKSIESSVNCNGYYLNRDINRDIADHN